MFLLRQCVHCRRDPTDFPLRCFFTNPKRAKLTVFLTTARDLYLLLVVIRWLWQKLDVGAVFNVLVERESKRSTPERPEWTGKNNGEWARAPQSSAARTRTTRL